LKYLCILKLSMTCSKYICALLYVLFTIQGMYKADALSLQESQEIHFFSHGKGTHVQATVDLIHVPKLLLTDDDDNDDKRRLFLATYQSTHQASALVQAHLITPLEVDYSSTVKLFFADASPPANI